MTRAAVLAIDGGNSKTEVALAEADGTVLACVQVGGFTPHLDGVADTIRALENALGEEGRKDDKK